MNETPDLSAVEAVKVAAFGMDKPETVRLHPDWPETVRDAGSWDSDGPYAELIAGFNDYPSFATASKELSVSTEPFVIDDIAAVTAYHVESGGEVWKPGSGYIGSELSMVIVGELVDGRWFSASLWNDYTGWGCQSGMDVRLASTEGEIYTYGLDERERNLLALRIDGPKAVS